MKLTVDCESDIQLLALPKRCALANLLSHANVTQLNLPLEAFVCQQRGLKPAPDYPIAAIAASADGLNVGDYYWLRADPVHLVLQRDSFSMATPVPLPVKSAHAELLVASLNAHFNQDGLYFLIGSSGAWYVRLHEAPQIKTTLPSAVVERNIFHFMPQGAGSSAWIAYLNEVQMLLHEHSVNIVRESAGEVAVNSVWFSGGGYMPSTLQANLLANNDFMVADSAFYQGLALMCNANYLPAFATMHQFLQSEKSQQHVRLQLPAQQLLEDDSFKVLLNGLRAKVISQLTINLGYYDKTLVAIIKPTDLYKFWRKSKALSAFLT